MIKRIAFDIGNVLFKVDHSDAWKQTQEHTSLEQEFLFDRFYNCGEMIDCLIGNKSDEQFFSKLHALMEFKAPLSTLMEIWKNVFQAIPHRLALVEKYSQKFDVTVLSNICKIHSDQVEILSPEIARLKRKTYSWECGFVKPRHEIFHDCQRDSDFKEDECLFIDDQAQHVEVARSLGWQAIQVSLDQDLEDEIENAIERSKS